MKFCSECGTKTGIIKQELCNRADCPFRLEGMTRALQGIEHSRMMESLRQARDTRKRIMRRK